MYILSSLWVPWVNLTLRLLSKFKLVNKLIWIIGKQGWACHMINNNSQHLILLPPGGSPVAPPATPSPEIISLQR